MVEGATAGNVADCRLVAECLAMDDAAWQRCLGTYRAMCRIIACTHNLAHEFDDLFSIFIVKLLGSAEGKPGVLTRYTGQVALKTYLSVVFHHIVIDWHRAAQRRPLHVQDNQLH